MSNKHFAGMAAAALPLMSTVFTLLPAEAASPQLTDRAVSAGISLSSTPSWDVCSADFDADGDEDFHASLHMKNAGALFSQASGGSFTRVATNVISPKVSGGGVDRHACAWADVDHNGLQDLYSSAGRYADNRVKNESMNNELFLQTSPGTWTDVATSAGVGEPCSRGRYVAFADFNGDGWDDLFVGNQNERADSADPCNLAPDYPKNEQSKLFLNRGKGSSGSWLGFTRADQYNVRLSNAGMRGAIPWDENRDGRMDLLALAPAGKLPYLFRNTGGGFQEVSRAKIVKLPAMNGAVVGDVTRDGIPDLVFADATGFAYRAGTASGVGTATVQLGTVPSGARAWRPALGDINGDGRTDVYGLVRSATGTGNPDDVVYVAGTAGFQPYVVPSAGGDGSDAEGVRVGGHDEFVVLNGGNDEAATPGPVQLIAWVG